MIEDNVLTVPAGREAKRDAILDAARAVFLEVGFGAASMDAIANAAKVSKQTVYNHFGSKEELFAAMIRSSCDRMLAAMEQAAKSGKPEDTLRAVAWQVMDKLFSKDRMSLYRILMAEVQRFPELGKIFYECGPKVTRKYLAGFFAEQTSRGLLKVENPPIAAEQFFGMLSGCHFKAQLGIETAPSREAIDEYVESAVALVMRAHSVPTKR
jgi:AcrR family transcriptional regulator